MPKPKARQKAAKQIKATEQDYQNLEDTVISGIIDNPLIPKDVDPRLPQYDKEDPRREGMDVFVRGMSPQDMQMFSYGRRPMKEGTEKVKDLEEMRMKKLLNQRARDEAAMREFKNLRKDKKLPEELAYGPNTIIDDFIGAYAHSRPDMIKDPEKYFTIRRSDSYYPGPEANLMAHEVGHVLEGEKLQMSQTSLPLYINREMYYAGQKGLPQEYIESIKKEYSKRSERNQRLYGPIKMGISRLFGTIPVNRAEYEVMKRKLSNPSVKARVIENALIVTDHEANVKGFKRKPIEKDIALDMFKTILEQAYDEILKGEGEAFEDFMTYAKADGQQNKETA